MTDDVVTREDLRTLVTNIFHLLGIVNPADAPIFGDDEIDAWVAWMMTGPTYDD